MAQNIEMLEEGSMVVGPLSEACRMCGRGSKMVLFVTGVCSANCYYCPVSIEKRGKDVIFADEAKLIGEEDTSTLTMEANSIEAEGTGITGGDPLEQLDRTLHYIRTLKEQFGSAHNIHLYTHLSPDRDTCKKLAEAGLDELRMHPPESMWHDMDGSPYGDSVAFIKEMGMKAALEVPAIPGYKEELKGLIKWADSVGFDYLNLNEFEFSDPNWEDLKKRGYKPVSDISFAVEGSAQMAREIIHYFAKKGLKNLGLHFCTVSFKDRIQLGNRIKRRAMHTSESYDVITEEGTLLRGIIEVNGEDAKLKGLYNRLREEFDVPTEFMSLAPSKGCIYIVPWILEDIAEDINEANVKSFIVERYPTEDKLEVEKIPLPM